LKEKEIQEQLAAEKAHQENKEREEAEARALVIK
jgi:hypothetical protein